MWQNNKILYATTFTKLTNIPTLFIIPIHEV
jgi:hypothetical protein